MRNRLLIKAAIPAIGFAACFSSYAEKLVILHTNDTHSTIEPLADGTGGILQRKAIMDSVRKAEKNVITVDAGDAVQGTLFFKYFHGDVEYPLMDMSGYDIRILGNHEFDNGMEALAHYYKNTKGSRLSTNYDFSGTELDGLFAPYVIKKVNGKKVGFIGINIDPSSLIAAKNIHVNFLDPITTANETAAMLKNKKGCDFVVAVTHIGYEMEEGKPSDIELAKASKDIDIIIGGHSHTLVDPSTPEETPSLIPNAVGRNVRVVQAGKQGRYIGKITIDLDNGKKRDGSDYEYELIPVTDRFPEEDLDARMIKYLIPYKERVDSADNVFVAWAAYDMPKERQGRLANLTADFAYLYGNRVLDSLRNENAQKGKVDLAIMNVGGIRHDMPEGKITEGQILSTYPFSNRFCLVELKGADIIEALRVSARKGGEAVSGNIRVVTDEGNNLMRVVIDGEEMDPDRNYILATIDYLAEGNDDLVSLANHRKIWISDYEVSVPILRWFRNQTALGLDINPDSRERFVKVSAHR